MKSPAADYMEGLSGRPGYIFPGSTTPAPGYTPPEVAAPEEPQEVKVKVRQPFAATQPQAPQYAPQPMAAPPGTPALDPGSPSANPPARQAPVQGPTDLGPVSALTMDEFGTMASDPAAWNRNHPGLVAGGYGATGQVATPERTYDGSPTFDEQRAAAIKNAGIKTGMDQATFDWLRSHGNLSPEQIAELKRQYPYLK